MGEGRGREGAHFHMMEVSPWRRGKRFLQPLKQLKSKLYHQKLCRSEATLSSLSEDASEERSRYLFATGESNVGGIGGINFFYSLLILTIAEA